VINFKETFIAIKTLTLHSCKCQKETAVQMLPKYSPVAICPATITADKIPKEDNVEFAKPSLVTLQDILD